MFNNLMKTLSINKINVNFIFIVFSVFCERQGQTTLRWVTSQWMLDISR
ncbi:hypothetical protein VIBNISFn118_800017 [Vibrio nigripulchritudo SFn118]|nr:hypothetical protein VIBNISFn118_800017 [Vibrio nigripulchritudo SFn118]